MTDSWKWAGRTNDGDRWRVDGTYVVTSDRWTDDAHRQNQVAWEWSAGDQEILNAATNIVDDFAGYADTVYYGEKSRSVDVAEARLNAEITNAATSQSILRGNHAPVTAADLKDPIPPTWTSLRRTRMYHTRPPPHPEDLRRTYAAYQTDQGRSSHTLSFRPF
eukprot:TRINITY_DN14679_c0_g1_i1.p1 TRINITY_DN14679_c0_g1~~TRINITY_DN14679_c0_g1_i1.p1  ORF type:complete len:163 (+),score=4.21 TRINITY_DN14679_c0_g1_i1:129-617(+)